MSLLSYPLVKACVLDAQYISLGLAIRKIYMYIYSYLEESRLLS